MQAAVALVQSVVVRRCLNLFGAALGMLPTGQLLWVDSTLDAMLGNQIWFS